MGVIVVSLYSLRPAAVLLVIPFMVAAALMARARPPARRGPAFERLYEASARTGGLDTLEQALASSASEDRGLVTGGSALCRVPTADGPNGPACSSTTVAPGPPTRDLVAVVVALVGRDGPREVPTSQRRRGDAAQSCRRAPPSSPPARLTDERLGCPRRVP